MPPRGCIGASGRGSCARCRATSTSLRCRVEKAVVHPPARERPAVCARRCAISFSWCGNLDRSRRRGCLTFPQCGSPSPTFDVPARPTAAPGPSQKGSRGSGVFHSAKSAGPRCFARLPPSRLPQLLIETPESSPYGRELPHGEQHVALRLVRVSARDTSIISTIWGWFGSTRLDVGGTPPNTAMSWW